MAVQGSLENPPIVIHASRAYTLVLLIVATMFVCIELLFWSELDSFMGYLGLALFGGGVLMAAYFLVRPRRIEISPEGAFMKHPFRSVSFRWRDVDKFEMQKLTSLGSSTVVGWICRRGANAANSPLTVFFRGTTGMDGYFPPGWEISTADLLVQLNDGMGKWGNADLGPAPTE